MKSMLRFLDGRLDDWRDLQAQRQTDWKIEKDISDVGNIKKIELFGGMGVWKYLLYSETVRSDYSGNRLHSYNPFFWIQTEYI